MAGRNTYKVYLLNPAGTLASIHIFQGTTDADPDQVLTDLFSEIDKATIFAENIPVVQSSQWILPDDSICTLKKKIMREMPAVCYDEIYLFGLSKDTSELAIEERRDTVTKIYQKESNQGDGMDAETFGQYAINLHFSESVLETMESKDVYSYSDWLQSMSEGFQVECPLGPKFSESQDFLFPVNPFRAMGQYYVPDKDNVLLSFENQLLFHYGDLESNVIYLCLADNVFDYAVSKRIEEEYVAELYFPLLYRRGIHSKGALDEQRPTLARETTALLSPSVCQLQDTISELQTIFYTKSAEPMPYVAKGIHAFELLISGGDFTSPLPLEDIFKNIHSNAAVPFIKFNPGNRRENMYRLFSKTISKNGKKIPALSETAALKLSRDIGKGKRQISLFLPKPENPVLAIILNVYPNGTMSAVTQSPLKTPISVDELYAWLSRSINPVLQTINLFLHSSGYKMRTFSKEAVLKSMVQYTSTLSISKEIALNKYMGCVSCIFDVQTTDVAAGAQLRFKRVENFQVMDAQDSLITEVYRLTGNFGNALTSLMENYQMTNEEALLRIGQYMTNHQQLGGEILEHPGFSVLIKMVPLKTEVKIDVANISSLAYIPYIEMYLDTMMRMTQFVGYQEMCSIASKKIKRGVGTDVGHVENAVAATTDLSEMTLHKAKPLVFLSEKEDAFDNRLEDQDQDQDDDDGGLFYEDDEEEEEEEEDADAGASVDELVDTGEQVEEEFGGVSKKKGGVSPAQGKEQEEEEEEGKEYKANIDGMPLNDPTPFFKRLKEMDPVLFLTKKEGNYKAYSTSCQSNRKRQPIILTEAEKARIDKEHPGSYTHALKYGSDPKQQYWYICPRYWCLLTNSSITQEEVDSGKCGTIIPDGAKKVPKGAYVYEFRNQVEHVDAKGEYVEHSPGFSDKMTHPNNKLCIPCCFKRWDSPSQKAMRDKCAQPDQQLGLAEDSPKKSVAKVVPLGPPGKKTNITYIISFAIMPIPQNRWGFLPMAMQLFLQINNMDAVSKDNLTMIKPNTPTLLRYGVEQLAGQSFLGCAADLYAYKQGVAVPTVDEFRQIMVQAIDLDTFLRYHNGSLISVFRPPLIQQADINIAQYEGSQFVRSVNAQTESEQDYVEEVIASYEHFQRYLMDRTSTIDHTYLWDMMVDANPRLMKDGLNLVICEMVDNDITDHIELLCPTNSYTSSIYNPKKETAILLKRGDYYEPVYLYEDRDNKINVKKTFISQTSIQNIRNMLLLIQNSTRKYCSPMSSLPKVYTMKKNLLASEIARTIKAMDHKIVSQVVNFQGKVIGLTVQPTDDTLPPLFVPTYPSSMMMDVKTQWMDEEDLWLDYAATRDRLAAIHGESNETIPCRAAFKVVEEKVVVGILTETNQFVQIDPPVAIESAELTDTIPLLQSSNYLVADKALTRNLPEDQVRVETTRRISLESQFYATFRTYVRMALNRYENNGVKQSILAVIANRTFMYRDKLRRLTDLLRALMAGMVVFQPFTRELIMTMDRVSECSEKPIPYQTDGSLQCDVGNDKRFCLMTADKKCQMILPQVHLVSGSNNETAYFARISDEMLRYPRIRNFLFQPSTYLNITNAQFSVYPDELFILQSLLTPDYFRDLEAFNTNPYIQNVNYETARPAMTQRYTSDISLEEQGLLMNLGKDAAADEMDEYAKECIESTREVIGNKQSMWKRIFPKTTKEVIYKPQVACSFYPILSILQRRLGQNITVQNVKTSLWNGYASLTGVHETKILGLLRKQGKRDMVDRIRQKKTTLENVVFSDEYYMTDLDWWVLAKQTRSPIILFSSTKLKNLSPTVDWLRLAGDASAAERFVFVRSPPEVKVNTPPAYHLIDSAFAISELKEFTAIFQSAMTGDAKYLQNVESLEEFLAKQVFIMRKG